MTSQIEIEFKNMLSKTKYDELCAIFDNEEGQKIEQENHYFDTADFRLKSLNCALRLRKYNDTIECTLKEKKAQHTSAETTDYLTEGEAQLIFEGTEWTAPTVGERLQQLNIRCEQLSLFGSLKTKRIEYPYEGGLLVLDHSFYLQQEDYEVEYETNDVEKGERIFKEFLTKQSIPYAKAPKKIARFATALAQQQERGGQ